MQVYVGLLYQDIVRQNHLAADGRLPPVLPLVLYHGAAPWRVSTDMAGLMLPPPAGLEPFQPEQRYLLIDRACFGSGRGGSDCNLIDSLFDMIDARSEAAIKAVLSRLIERLQDPGMAPVRDSVTRWIRLTLPSSVARREALKEAGWKGSLPACGKGCGKEARKGCKKDGNKDGEKDGEKDGKKGS